MHLTMNGKLRSMTMSKIKTKAREWLIKTNGNTKSNCVYQQPTDVGISSIHVREILPGEVVITRVTYLIESI